MTDLVVGDLVICVNSDGKFNQLRTIEQIIPVNSPTPDGKEYLYFTREDVADGISFYRHELLKTHSIKDIDNQIKAMEIL